MDENKRDGEAFFPPQLTKKPMQEPPQSHSTSGRYRLSLRNTMKQVDGTVGAVRTKISHQHEPSVQHHSPDSVSAFTSRCLRQSTAELFKPFIVSPTSTSDSPPPE